MCGDKVRDPIKNILIKLVVAYAFFVDVIMTIKTKSLVNCITICAKRIHIFFISSSFIKRIDGKIEEFAY